MAKSKNYGAVEPNLASLPFTAPNNEKPKSFFDDGTKMCIAFALFIVGCIVVIVGVIAGTLWCLNEDHSPDIGPVVVRGVPHGYFQKPCTVRNGWGKVENEAQCKKALQLLGKEMTEMYHTTDAKDVFDTLAEYIAYHGCQTSDGGEICRKN